MIVLIETVEEAARFRRAEVIAETQTFSRAKVMRVTIPLKVHHKTRRRERAVRRTLTELCDDGVTRAVVPPDFGYAHLLRECGIATPDTVAFRRALALLYTEHVMDTRFHADTATSAAVYAERPCRECDAVVLRLLERCRTVAVAFARGGGDYAARMYAQHGATVLQTESAFSAASLCVLLSRPSGYVPTLGAVVVDCTMGARLIMPEWFVPQPFCPAQMAAELYRTGVLRLQDIGLNGIVHTNTLDFLPSTHYNIAQFKKQKQQKRGNSNGAKNSQANP